MADNLTPEQRRKNMQRIRSTGTKAERIVMEELGKKGLKFISYDNSIIGKPDIVFPEKKIAVFIDSDFWHANPKRFIKPKTNVEYWEEKIARNKKRDRKVNRELKTEGWAVVRIWEYDVKHNLSRCIKKILKKLNDQ
ncbi:DNA mismatch endonuclease Vsr [uncultured archaeon]|nr:DNA mismatch endonuclease Vsr [uncultured archaeon]